MLELDTQSFQNTVAPGKGVVVVDFWAPWCGPCKQFGPIFEDAAGEVDNATFAKVNVDSNQDIAQKYQVMSIPTVIVFKDGEVVEQFVGAKSKQDLIAVAAKHQ